MKRPGRLIGMILLIVAMNCGGVAAQEQHDAITPSSATPSLDDLASLGTFVDGVLHAQMRDLQIPAAVVAIVKDDRVIYAKGYGHANIEKGTPVDPATSLFHIGSTGKLFTWTAVMQLVEQGKLDLDADVNTYLKTFQIPATFPQPVTLRHLMTHTAGFEEGVVGYLLSFDPSTIRPIEETLRVHMPDRVRPPGEFTSYSNYGASLAGLIVEQVSGEPYADYIERHIYAPLGIKYASFREPLPPSLAPHAITAYVREDGAYVAQPYEINGGFSPSGGTSISALDFARFMLAYLNDGQYDGGRILKPETVKLMHARAFTHDERLPGMALGFQELPINGRSLVGHDGDSVGFHTDFHLLHEHRLGIFVSYEHGANGDTPREGLAQALFDRYFPTQAQRPQALTLGPDAQKYAGTYRMLRLNYTDFDKFFTLLLPPIEVAILPNDRLLLSGGFGPDSQPLQFERTGEHLFQEVNGPMQIAFRADEAGNITRLFFTQTVGTERVPWYELPSLWFAILGIAVLLFASVFVQRFFRRKEFATMAAPERRALWLSTATAGWLAFSLLMTAMVIATYQVTLLYAPIPFALKALLAMPLVFVALSVALAVAAVGIWRRRAWTVGRRIHFTLVTLAAIAVSWFFHQWNLLGWQFG